MQAAKRLHRSDQNTPHLFFREDSFFLFMLEDFLVDIPLARIVHYNAQELALVYKGIFVADYVFMVNAGQYADFI